MTRQAQAVLKALALSLLVFGFPAEAKKEYCALLTPEDFKAAGVAGAGKPTTSTDDAGAFCVYAGKSSSTGGIEFDFFVAPSASDSEAIWAEARPQATNRTSVAKSLPGVEQAEIAKVPGKTPHTALGVKRGKVVFHIGVPASAKSQEAILALARLVLQRSDKLGR